MTFKSKIVSFFSSRKVNVFTLFLILALLFSVLTKLSKDYTQTVVFNLKYKNIPENIVIINDSTHVLNITLSTYGFKLIKYYMSKPSVVINFNPLEKFDTHYLWEEKREFSKIVSQFEQNVKIETVNTSTIVFRYGSNQVKKIPVILDAAINFSSGFDLISDYIITPDSIKVIGPKILTDSISQIVTKKLVLEDVNTTISNLVMLKLPKQDKNLKYSHSQVQITAKVDKFTEGSISVPVTIINVPDSIKLKYYPKEVSVIYYTSLSDFKSITSSSFIVECDYKLLSNQDTYLIPKIVKQPNRIKKLRLTEKRIEFILLN